MHRTILDLHACSFVLAVALLTVPQSGGLASGSILVDIGKAFEEFVGTGRGSHIRTTLVS